MCSNTASLTAHEGRATFLSALATQHCRSVIAYFRNASSDHASVDEVASTLAGRDNVDETQIATRLHHAVLPKLDDVGLIDYDARTNTARYHGHTRLEDVDEFLSESDYPGETGNK